MKYFFILITLFQVYSANARQSADTIPAIDSFVCAFKCSNTLDIIKRSCPTTTLRDRPLPGYNVNPYEEFDLIISALSRDRNNPYPMLYKFRECEEVCNAAAVTFDTTQYIYYSQSFLNNLRSANERLKWTIRSIIAHEIGHHILAHSRPKPGGISLASRRKQELEADYFSAFVIKQFPGGTLDHAMFGLHALDSLTYSPQSEQEERFSLYPTLSKRREAIIQGFEDNKDDAFRIAMFKNMDSLALLAYRRSGRSIILREFDRAISFNNLQKASELISQLKNQNLMPQQNELLIKADKIVGDLQKSSGNTSIDLPEGQFTQQEILELEILYEKYKRGFTTEDRKKADSLLQKIKELKSKSN